MSRWQPDARGRLGQAAMELYSERGFEQTTVAEIAARAGLTERTFFRHYGDKREVLFFGADVLQKLFVGTLVEALDSKTPIEAMMAAVEAAAVQFQPNREHSLQRQLIINENSELQERELIKLATLSAALATVLRAHGVADPTATLTAEVGIVVFKVAFDRWVTETDPPEYVQIVRESFAQVKAVTGEILDATI